MKRARARSDAREPIGMDGGARGGSAGANGTRNPQGFPIVFTKFCTPENIALFAKHLECLGVSVASVQKTPGYCWRTYFHAIQPRLLRWILQVPVLQQRHMRGTIFGPGGFANSIRPL